MKLRSFAALADFKKDFFRMCIEGDAESDGHLLYSGYIELLKKYGHADCECEGRIVGVNWAWSRFFDGFRPMVAGNIDLVVWGCDDVLDILAFYDQAMRCDIPQIWTLVRSVVLLDPDESRLKWAEGVAEMLFPLAYGHVRAVRCDLTSTMDLTMLVPDVQAAASDGLVPRLNIVSPATINAVDPEAFAECLKNALRRDGVSAEYNEVFFVRGGALMRDGLAERMSKFTGCFSRNLTAVVEGDEPISAYSAFAMVSHGEELLFQAVRAGHPVVKYLLDVYMRSGKDKGWLALIDVLSHLKVNGRAFIDIYRHVKMINVMTGGGRKVNSGKTHAAIKALVFAPEDGAEYKVLVLKLGKCATKDENAFEKLDLASAFVEESARDSESGEIKELAEKIRSRVKGVSKSAAYGKLFSRWVVVKAWNSESGALESYNQNYEDNYIGSPASCGLMFGLSSADAGTELLPESLNADQRNVVYGRRRTRLVRGGPGTGKTISLLNHALMVFERTHLPVLVVTKTNSLLGNNRRRLAASFYRKFPKSEVRPEAAVKIVTVNELLCQLARGIHIGSDVEKYSCYRIRCRECLRGKYDARQIELGLCGSSQLCCNHEKAMIAIGLKDSDPYGIPVDRDKAYMDVLSSACEQCNYGIRVAVGKGNVMIPVDNGFLMAGVFLFNVWGGVMVDESQLIDCEDLKIIYAMTEHFNPWREFCVFADEEQSIRGGTLGMDDSGKLSVLVPEQMGRRWKTLRGCHRVQSRNLLKVYRRLQLMMSAKYDISELIMSSATEEVTDDVRNVDGVFRVERAGWMPRFDDVVALSGSVGMWAQSQTLTIVVDDEATVREFSGSAGDDWVKTHLNAVRSDNDRRKERKMKCGFKEKQGRIHLTTVDCSQGRTFENVVFIVTRDVRGGNVEEAFVGFTRASRHLYVVDASPSGWAYDLLNVYGKGDFLAAVTKAHEEF